MEPKMNNPFNIAFGEEPSNFIPRENETNQITQSFDSIDPESRTYIITGPRGSGKTVLLSHIKRIYEEKPNWLTVALNPYGDMVEQLCAKIYETGKTKRLFLQTEFSFSFKGFGFSISGKTPVSNVESLAEKMFSYLKKKSIRVLITVDDIVCNDNMRYFAHSYQTYIGEKYPLFLLMSGLYENVFDLERDKGLTFLVRAPKIYLERLNLAAVCRAYSRLLGVNLETASSLARLTMGYAYGFQLLGNLIYRNDKKLDGEVMEQFDLTLESNVFSLIWRSLSAKDKDVLIAIAEGHNDISDIMERCQMNNSTIQVYRGRLKKAGLVDTETRGQLHLTLPRFKEYILMQKEFGQGNIS